MKIFNEIKLAYKTQKNMPHAIGYYNGCRDMIDGFIYDYTKMLVDCRVEQKPGIHKCLEHLLVIKRKHFKEDQS